MTIACTNKERICDFRRAGLCFNPCVLKAAQSATKMARAVAEGKGKVDRIERLDF